MADLTAYLTTASPIFQILSIVLLALFGWISAAVVYRLTLHPLAGYPGPLLARLTNWYSVYHAWKGDRHLEFWRCHERYGPIVRFGPNSLAINTRTALRDIYGFKANVRKADFYSAFPPNRHTFNTHSSIDKGSHARKRRVLAQAFSDNALKSMEPYVLANVRSFCQALFPTRDGSVEKSSTDWGPAQNMADWCSYLAFDVMGDLCFGKAFGMVDKHENRFAVDLVSKASHRHLICGTMPMIHELHLDKVLFSKLAAGRSRYMAYSKSQASERTKMGLKNDRKDFFYYLLNAKDPETGNGFTASELWGESNLLIIAGSDTTSTALSSTLFYLNHNPKARDKATQEICQAFETAENIRSGSRLQSCVYFRACIDEALRLSPPVAGLLPRAVLPGGLTVDGYYIPEGTVVGTCHYAVHHNPDYFPGPFEYRPERWIVDSAHGVTEEAVALAQSAFCPFSLGPRGCIGRGMAYMELLTTLARLLFLYDMRLAPGEQRGAGQADLEWGRHRPKEFQLIDIFTSSKDGPLVQFRQRSEVGVEQND